MRTLSLFLIPAMLALLGQSAFADEASVKAALQKKYPNQIQIQSVTKTPLAGIYEVYADGQILYTDEKAAFLFIGSDPQSSVKMIDTERKVDLTEERLSKLNAINFDQLPLNLAFKRVKGNGSRKLVVFSDPDCPFCKRVEGDLAKLDNVTIYTFLYPIDSLHPQARDKAKRIWCSSDRVKAWDDALVRGVSPSASPACDNPVDRTVELGNKYKVTGTPTLVFADGTRVPGAIPFEQIEQRLASARPVK
jgi:thiol:disulfide interchange protein DsbC